MDGISGTQTAVLDDSTIRICSIRDDFIHRFLFIGTAYLAECCKVLFCQEQDGISAKLIGTAVCKNDIA